MSQGNITAVFLFDNKHDSYHLEFLLLCVEDWGYFFDDPIVKEGIAVCPVEIFLVWKNIQRFI
jgi:hypothetical protein